MKYEKTGRFRYRLDDKRKLVLQIEELKMRTYSLCGSIECDYYKEFRDATVEDLTEFKLIRKDKQDGQSL